MFHVSDSQKNANCRYPTLLHFAAAKGLAELCSALVECPGSSRAYYVRNCDGLDPADLAFQEEFDELGNYIIDFMVGLAACWGGHTPCSCTL